MSNILVVGDERDIADLLEVYLKKIKYKYIGLKLMYFLL